MFKAASQNAQNRARNGIAHSRVNTGGVDSSTFKAPECDSKQELIAEKTKLQEKSSVLKRQIALAKRRYAFREAGRVSYETLCRWEAERTNIASQLTALDKRLTELKFDQAVKQQAEGATFDETFKEIAKEMLAEPVYDRLILATVHRVSEMARKGETTCG